MRRNFGKKYTFLFNKSDIFAVGRDSVWYNSCRTYGMVWYSHIFPYQVTQNFILNPFLVGVKGSMLDLSIGIQPFYYTYTIPYHTFCKSYTILNVPILTVDWLKLISWAICFWLATTILLCLSIADLNLFRNKPFDLLIVYFPFVPHHK